MSENKKNSRLITFLEMFFGNIYIGISIFVLITAIIAFIQSILLDSGKNMYFFSIRHYLGFTPSRATHFILLIIFLYVLRITNKILETKIDIKNSNKFTELVKKENNKKSDVDKLMNEVTINLYDATKYMSFSEFYYEHLEENTSIDFELVKSIYYRTKVWYLRKRVLGHFFSLMLFFFLFLTIDMNLSINTPEAMNIIFLSVFLFQIVNILLYGFKYLINYFALSIPDSKDRMTIVVALFGTIISLIALFKK